MPRIIVVLVLSWLTACASTPQTTALLRPDLHRLLAEPVVLNEVPFFSQKEYQCGPAALATLLQVSHVDVTPAQLVPLVYLPDRQGSLQVEMLAATRAYDRISYALRPSLEAVLKEVQHRRPVLVLQNLGLSWYPRWHYAVVVGYDIAANQLLLRSGVTRDYSVSLSLFERTWQRAGHWAMVVLQPGEMPLEPDELRYFESIAALEHASPGANVESAYLAGLKQWPQSQVLGMGLGNLWYRQGRKQGAAEQYARVIQENPAYAPAHNNLAQVLLELGDRSSAAEHARMAVMLGGAHSEVYQQTLQATGEP